MAKEEATYPSPPSETIATSRKERRTYGVRRLYSIVRRLKTEIEMEHGQDNVHFDTWRVSIQGSQVRIEVPYTRTTDENTESVISYIDL